MRVPGKGLAVSAMAAAMLLSGCSGAVAGDATSAAGEQAPSQAEQAIPADGAPSVSTPIEDTARFQDDPCLMLTSQDLRTLGLTSEAERGTGPGGPICRWRNAETGATADVQWGLAAQDGLSGFYANRRSYSLFAEQEPIGGHPVLAAGDVDDHALGFCTLYVGVTDELTYQAGVALSTDLRGKADACTAARTVAELMLDQISGGA